MTTLAIPMQARSDVPDPPCDHGCPHRSQCAASKLACYDFEEYVNGRGFGIDDQGREPNRYTYESIYHRCDAEVTHANGRVAECRRRMIEGPEGVFYCFVHDAEALAKLRGEA